MSVREPENDEVDIEPESPENERAEKLQKSGAVVVVSLQKTESPDPHPDPGPDHPAGPAGTESASCD